MQHSPKLLPALTFKGLYDKIKDREYLEFEDLLEKYRVLMKNCEKAVRGSDNINGIERLLDDQLKQYGMQLD